jgi:hypothetical protein
MSPLEFTTKPWNFSHVSRAPRPISRQLIDAPTETAIPEVSSEDHVGDFLRLAVSRAQRICTGRADR